MGIPLYYKNIINDYPEIIHTSLNFKKKINNLFFDLNCAIHPCCANKINEKDMFNAILEKIKECISLTNVTDLIYIAIDGPCPRTKMEQQRQRRLKSSQEYKIWDTNQITPGTRFMDSLNQFLKKSIKDFKIKTILSDSNEAGEGEHKIMHYLDKNIKHTDTNIVYGLDADLIMLSMIRCHNVFLLRERTEYNLENINEPYIYLDICLLKEHVINKIKEPSIKYTITDKTILNDYLFICFLIGNDFILNTPCINIRYNGLEYITKIYCNLQKDFFGDFYLTQNQEINLLNLRRFIKEISKQEETIIKTILKKRGNQQNRNTIKFNEYLEKIKSIDDISNHTYQDFDSQDDLAFTTFKHFSPTIFRDIENIIFNKNYNIKYYTYNIYNTLDYNPSFNQILEKDIQNICQEYFKAIQWTFNYYFKSCISWRWYYKYHFAPLMIDFNKYLSNANFNSFDKDKPNTPKEQLKIVLPLQNNSYLYPKKTPLYSLFKSYYWECHPILPH